MSRFAPAVILLSLALCACQSTAMKASGTESNSNASLTASTPGSASQPASAVTSIATPPKNTSPAGTPAAGDANQTNIAGVTPSNSPSVTAGTPADSNPVRNSRTSPLASAVKEWAHDPRRVMFTCLGVFGFGYVLLQIYAGAALVGRRRPAAGFFGHVFTGFVFIFVRLFDNAIRFVCSEFTCAPQGAISLLTGNPKPNANFDPRPAPSPAKLGQVVRSEMPGVGSGLPGRGGAGRIGLMQDVRDSSESLSPTWVAAPQSVET
jgi:hypothetical protein